MAPWSSVTRRFSRPPPITEPVSPSAKAQQSPARLPSFPSVGSISSDFGLSPLSAPPPDYEPPAYSLDPPDTLARTRNRYAIDPRLTIRHRSHPDFPTPRGLPPEVVTIICQSLVHTSPSTLAAIARVNQECYDIVIPYLYHSVPVTQHTFPLLLYGTDERLPENERETALSFMYTSRWQALPGSTETTDVPEQVRERRRRAFAHVREVRLEGLAPEYRYVSTVLGPDTTLFPNAKRLRIAAGSVLDLAYYSHFASWATDKNHPLISCLRRIVRPDTVHIYSSFIVSGAIPYSSNPQAMSRLAREAIEQLCLKLGGVEAIAWHGLTSEYLPRIPGAHHTFHYAPIPSDKHEVGVDERITTLRAGLATAIPEALSQWQICGAGLVWANNTDTKEKSSAERIIHRVILGHNEAEGVGAAVSGSVEWYSSTEAAKLPRLICGCYGKKVDERLVLEDEQGSYGVNVAEGVRRSTWNPSMALRRQDP